MIKNLLITGRPGVGKTTLLKRIVNRCADRALTGFYSEELLENGVRVGFRAVTLNGTAGVFAHVRFAASPRLRVGRYGVKPEALEAVVLPHIDLHAKSADLVVVDEIAKMELCSQLFKSKVLEILDSERPLIATVALKGTGFVKRVKERRDVEVFSLTERNRDILGEQIYRRLRTILPGGEKTR